MPMPARGRPPICDVELRQYSRLVTAKRQADQKVARLDRSINALERVIREREQEEEGARNRSLDDMSVSELARQVITNGGIGQPGTPYGIGAAFEFGDFLHREGETVRAIADQDRLRRLRREYQQAQSDAELAMQAILAQQQRLNALGCPYNRSLRFDRPTR